MYSPINTKVFTSPSFSPDPPVISQGGGKGELPPMTIFKLKLAQNVIEDEM